MQPGEVGDGKENIPSNNKNGFSRPTPMSSIGSCPKWLKNIPMETITGLLHRCRDRKSETMKSALPTGGITTTGGYGTKSTSLKNTKKISAVSSVNTVSNPSLNLKPSGNTLYRKITTSNRRSCRLINAVESATCASGNTWAGIIRYRKISGKCYTWARYCKPGPCE